MGPELADWPDNVEEEVWDAGLDSSDIELQAREMMRQKRAEDLSLLKSDVNNSQSSLHQYEGDST